jgi:hypothetical protein
VYHRCPSWRSPSATRREIRVRLVPHPPDWSAVGAAPTGLGRSGSAPGAGRAAGGARRIGGVGDRERWCLGDGEPASLLPPGFTVLEQQDLPGHRRQVVVRRNGEPNLRT